MKRLVEIATTTHAWAVSIYVVQAVQGLLYVLGIAQARNMTELVGAVVAGLWPILLIAGGGVATVAVFMARNPASTLPGLKMEMYGVIAIGVANALYEATLIIGNGPFEVVTTQSYALMLVAGSIARLVQIRRERSNVRDRLRDPDVVAAAAKEDGAE